MKKQSGFTVLEILIVLILVIVLVAVSIFATARIMNRKEPAQSNSRTAKMVINKEQHNQNFVYEPADKAYKIALPDGWEFMYIPASEDADEKISYLSAAPEQMNDTPGIKAHVTIPEAQGGPETGLTLSVHENIGGVGYGEEMTSLGSFKTSQGLTVDAFVDKQAVQPFSDGENTNGYVEYMYFLPGKTHNYKFIYAKTEDQKDRKSQIEKMIKTIQIPS